MRKFILWLIARFKEPSTWRGVAAFITAAGVSIAPELWDQIVVAGVAGLGLVEMIAKDKLPPGPG